MGKLNGLQREIIEDKIYNMIQYINMDELDYAIRIIQEEKNERQRKNVKKLLYKVNGGLRLDMEENADFTQEEKKLMNAILELVYDKFCDTYESITEKER